MHINLRLGVAPADDPCACVNHIKNHEDVLVIIKQTHTHPQTFCCNHK